MSRGTFNLRTASPPVSAKSATACCVDDATAAIDCSIERTRLQNARAEDCRTRLIPDVVTGKLDVHEAATKRPEVNPVAKGSRRAKTQAPSDSPILESIGDRLSLRTPAPHQSTVHRNRVR